MKTSNRLESTDTIQIGDEVWIGRALYRVTSDYGDTYAVTDLSRGTFLHVGKEAVRQVRAHDDRTVASNYSGHAVLVLDGYV